MSPFRSLFHPATTLGAVAILLGLSSTAFAAGVITGADIKDGSVTTADIRNGTLKTADLASGTVNNLRGARGPAGPAGPAGSQGVSGYEIVSAASPATVPANTHTELGALCPAGKKALSGSAFWEASDDAVQVDLLADGSGVSAFSPGVSAADKMHLVVVCAAAG